MKPLALLAGLALFLSPIGNVRQKYHLEDPFRFVIGQFKTHEVIFLGESHRVKENLLFLQDLMPVLHKNGIHILFYEFANHDDSTRINRLLNAEFYDEALAQDIIRAVYLNWNYKEYTDVFRAAWQINRNCRKNEKRFRIIGINSSKWNTAGKPRWLEENWAECIYHESVSHGEKALVYCGAQHALTKFRMPRAVDGKFAGFTAGYRVGQCLYRRIGDRCMTLWYHQVWPDPFNEYRLSPFRGALDSIISSLPANRQSFAFDTRISPLGELTDTSSLYSLGDHPVQLRQMVDGYIVLKVLGKLTAVSPGAVRDSGGGGHD